MSMLPTPITNELALILESIPPARLLRQMAELERDCMTLALRLYGENDNTFSPPTMEVMGRWRPRAKALLDDK